MNINFFKCKNLKKINFQTYPCKISYVRQGSKNRTKTLNLVTKFRKLPQEKAILKEKTWKNKRKKENKLICW